MVDLTGKVALVTGAARGQGAAEARLFVDSGARVVLTDVLETGGSSGRPNSVRPRGSSATTSPPPMTGMRLWQWPFRNSAH